MYKQKIVEELISRAKKYGSARFGKYYIHPKENTSSSIIFNDIAYNFHHKSWQQINTNQECKKRTLKVHSNSVMQGLLEMQSCNSSDALAMSIFCFPGFRDWGGTRKLFNVKTFNSIEFGFKPEVYKYENSAIIGDSTEIDMFINNHIVIECKLTEDGFYEKEKEEVEKYTSFNDVFHADLLPQTNNKYLNYQLLRNILAAYQMNGRFILICDMRRPDLVKSFFKTTLCIKDDFRILRQSCEVIYWQDIASVCGSELREYLIEKYGL